MAKLSHRLEYLALKGMSRLVQLPSLKLADRLGAGLGTLFHNLFKSRRLIAHQNLRAAFGPEMTEEQIAAVTRRVFQNIGRTIVEIARFPALGRDRARELMQFEDMTVFEKVRQEGKGGILVAAHFGNWELLGASAALRGFDIDFLVGTLHNPLINNFMMESRKSIGMSLIPLATGMRAAFKSLKLNRFVGLTPDQHASSGRVVLDFFGRPASMAKGPALMAIRMNCPIVPFISIRERYDRHVAQAGEPIYPPQTGDEEADIAIMTAAYFKYFEEQIRAHPDQWMWTHRRWKVKPDRREIEAG